MKVKPITKKHDLFGEIRFINGKPYLTDILKSLNYKDDDCLSLVEKNVSLLENGIYVIDDIGIKKLINNSNIKVPILFKQWLFDFILPSVRRCSTYEIIPVKKKGLEFRTHKLNKLFSKYLDNIKDDEWITVPVHGFSNNRMYSFTEDGHVVKSDAYKIWRKKFPYHYLDKLSHLDFSKPIQACYVFDKKEEFDTPNLSKSLSDVITNYFGVDDHQIVNQISIQGEIVNSYEEGKIHIYMYNI